MERIIYQRMAAQEERHWWFVARRRILDAVLARHLGRGGGARVLEAGCGTGGNLALLARWGRVSAFEPDDEARGRAERRGDYDIRAGALPRDLPFVGEAFDLVALLDVLEHLDEDQASLTALSGLVRPGGWLLVTVPAFPRLWSAHDERHRHRRRYRRGNLEARLRAAGLEPVYITHFNTLLFPLIAGLRLLRRWLGLQETADEEMPGPLVNRLLLAIFSLEHHFLGRWSLPFGVSLLALARRRAAVDPGEEARGGIGKIT